MEKGLLHIYYGDGKGKTTAALGLILRAAGCGKKAAVFRFLKGNGSGELCSLKKLGIPVISCGECGFAFSMSEDEKQDVRKRHDNMLEKALASDADVIVLDEVLDAFNEGLCDPGLFKKLIDTKKNAELILTGHKKNDEIFAYADYITHMAKEKHPFDNGVTARKGIEF